MKYPIELNLTKFQVDVLFHRIALLTDGGMIEELYEDRSENTRTSLSHAADKFSMALSPQIAVSVTLNSITDAEILAEALEGSTYFGNVQPTTAQHTAILKLAAELTPLVKREVVPYFN